MMKGKTRVGMEVNERVKARMPKKKKVCLIGTNRERIRRYLTSIGRVGKF